jgi:hypothetical protein
VLGPCRDRHPGQHPNGQRRHNAVHQRKAQTNPLKPRRWAGAWGTAGALQERTR